jgi:hypothetical protein
MDEECGILWSEEKCTQVYSGGKHEEIDPSEGLDADRMILKCILYE